MGTPRDNSAVNASECTDTGAAMAVDLQDALKRLAAFGAGAPALLLRFYQHQQNVAAEIEQALQARDFTRVHRLAHSLKGSAGTLGFMQLQDTAAALEAAVSGSPGPSGAPAELTMLSARVGAAAQPVFAALSDFARAQADTSAETDDHGADLRLEVQRLQALLTELSPDAHAAAVALSRRLAGKAGHAEACGLSDCLERFEFEAASCSLQALLRRLPDAVEDPPGKSGKSGH